MKEISRAAEERIVRSLKSFPVVYIAGPRQSGKTTLVQRIANKSHKADYLTFDDLQTRSAAQRDPEAFARSLEGPVVLDEIQMVPELFRALKIIVDENRKARDGGKGRFLLTGSANVMALPQLSEALVGRMALHELLPFSAQEIQKGRTGNFVDRVFSQNWSFEKRPGEPLTDILRRASFPELSDLSDSSVRYEWCNGYLNTILQRDIRLLLEIEKIAALPDMLRLMATRTGGLLNEASLAKATELNHITAKKYRTLLQNLFLTLSIPAWSLNLGKRLVKSPKIYISDMNLLVYLLNIDFANISAIDHKLFGSLLENFVAIELTKQLTFSETRARLYHYRTASGQEVDFILEGPQNAVAAIEVKSTSRVTANDFRHLEALRNELGKKFKQGLVFYQGADVVPFGKDMWAIPVAMLWK